MLSRKFSDSKISYTYFISFLLFIVSIFNFGYTQHLNIRNYGIKTGLAQSQVQTIIQDDEGYLWFGTANGVSKFDGLNFYYFNKNDGLVGNYIMAGMKDKGGNLWFGHSTGSVTRYNWQTGVFEALPLLKGQQALKNINISKIFQDSQDNVWICTLGRGLFLYKNNQLFNYTTADGLCNNEVYSICQVNDSTIWLGTYNGISAFKLDVDSTEHRFIEDKLCKQFPSIYAKTIMKDRNGYIWIGTGRGTLLRYRPEERVIEYDTRHGLNCEGINALFEDSNGKIWVGSDNSGVFQLIPDTVSAVNASFRPIRTANGLAHNAINTIFEDNETNLWIGTNGRGVSQLRDECFEVYGEALNLPDNSVWSILVDSRGAVWLGSDLGITKMVTKTGGEISDIKHFEKINGKKINAVLNIIEDRRGDVWFISLNRGIFKWQRRQNTFKEHRFNSDFSSANVVAVNQDKEGNMWFGSAFNGLLQYNPHTKEEKILRATTHKISSDTINVIYKDRNGKLWFGTDNGGIMKYENGSFSIYSMEKGYPIHSAISITEDKWGNIWFIGNNDDLFRFDHKRFKSFTNYSGLNGETLYSINSDDKSIWVGTSHGLSRLFYGDTSFVPYGSNEGYPISETNENAVFKESNGNLWFGTIEGAVKFYPQRESKNNRPPDTRITKIRVFLKDAPIPESGKFPTDKNYLTFHFIGINFYAPERVSYQYKLEGFDKNWSPVSSENYATYSNLSPGKYTFKVKAQNGLGVWNAEPATYSFEILTPYWMNWWFYTILILSIAILIYVFVKMRIKKIERDKLTLEAEVQKRTSQFVTEKNKVQLANEMLLAEKERLAVTLRSIGEGVITTNTEGKILLMNQVAEKLCGVSHSEARSKPLFDIFYVVDEKSNLVISNPVFEVIDSGDLIISEHNNILISKDNKKINIAYSSAPIRDRESKIIGVVLVFRDISQQLKIEKELQKSQKLESVGILAGGIAHDFNNILTAILGNLSLAKLRTNPEDKIYKQIQSAEKASIRAQELIQQLLTFSKGGAPIRKTTSIEDLITESAGFVLRGSNVKLDIDIDNNLMTVDVDEGQISQVIQNIVINANQAMPNGGAIKICAKNIEVYRETGLPLNPGKYISIIIEDEGSGIPPGILHKIFDPFFTTKQNGSGLGLATAYSIIQKHDGHITADSNLGKGSKFNIYLPASNNKVVRKKKTERIEFSGSGKILLMDDEIFVRETTSDMLSYLGFTVESVPDGEQAIASYSRAMEENEPFDLVIMDLTIPGGMGGKAAISELLKIDPQANAIVSSGYASDPIMANAENYGFKGCLKKPFKVNEIAHIIQSLGVIRK